MRSTALLTFVTLLLPAQGSAQQLEPRPIPSGNGESVTLRSPSMEPRYDTTVGTPSGQTRLVAKLRSRNCAGLKPVVEIHDGLGHGDAAPAILARGLRSHDAR